MIEDSADTICCTPETDVSTTSFYASHIITAGGMTLEDVDYVCDKIKEYVC